MDEDSLKRLRASLAEYEAHRERVAAAGSDPDADWWYAAWAEALVPALKAIVKEWASPAAAAIPLGELRTENSPWRYQYEREFPPPGS